EAELNKLLATLHDNVLSPAPVVASAHANRVPVENGHTVCMSVGFDNAPTPEDAMQVLRTWRGFEPVYGLPTAPTPPIIVRDEPNRPQPRRDAMAGGGMAVTVGRVRPDNLFDLRLVAMSHN